MYMTSQPSVSVIHPERQYSHQLAAALAQAHLLDEYWTGTPTLPARWSCSPYGLLRKLSSQPTVPLPPERVRHCFAATLTGKFSHWLLPDPWSDWGRYWGTVLFDRWMARRVHRMSARVVVGYENAAVRIFEEASRQGKTCVLDAASLHYSFKEQYLDLDPDAELIRRRNRRKQREIDLADHILTLSEFAAETYVEGGVDPAKITSVHLGYDASVFQPRSGINRRETDEPPTFIYVGNAPHRKGLDVLFEAVDLLSQTHEAFRVLLVGDLQGEEVPDGVAPHVRREGYLSQEELAERYHRSDCLVLPSRDDSFGMVVVEGMACGVPAIISEHVGAREIVREDRTGWIVPNEAPEALAERMAWCVEHIGRVRGMRGRTAEAVADHSWRDYHGAVADVFREMLDRSPPDEDPFG